MVGEDDRTDPHRGPPEEFERKRRDVRGGSPGAIPLNPKETGRGHLQAAKMARAGTRVLRQVRDPNCGRTVGRLVDLDDEFHDGVIALELAGPSRGESVDQDDRPGTVWAYRLLGRPRIEAPTHTIVGFEVDSVQDFKMWAIARLTDRSTK